MTDVNKMRAEFEEWHNKFYGPQSKYNPIRSLAYDSCEVGLGYDDPVVQAQFVSFCGALDAKTAEQPAGEAVAWVEHMPGGGVAHDAYHEAVKRLPAGVRFDLHAAPPAQVPDARLVESLEHAAKWIDELVEGHDRKHAWPSDFIDVAEQIRADLAEYRAAPKGDA